MKVIRTYRSSLVAGVLATTGSATLAIWPALAQKSQPPTTPQLKPGSAPWNYSSNNQPFRIPALAASRIPLDAQGIHRRNMPSTVWISNGQGVGSGVLLDRSGLILTNDHVVRGGGGALGGPVPDKVAVVFADHKQMMTATVLRSNYAFDTALLKLDQPLPSYAKPASVCFRNAARPGQKIFILGNPAQYIFSISQGTISALPLAWTLNMSQLAKFIQLPPARLIQVDGFVNGGNSGGPVFNQYGEVVSIVSFGSTIEDRLNYTIPIASALNSVKVSVVPTGRAATACGNPQG